MFALTGKSQGGNPGFEEQIINKDLADYFLEQAKLAFFCLESAPDFSSPQLQVDSRINFATVTFSGKRVAIECILDERDEDITCKIVRLIDGFKPSQSYLDNDGNRVSEALTSIVRGRGVRTRLFRRVDGLTLRERIPVTLQDFAHMLSVHAPDLIAR